MAVTEAHWNYEWDINNQSVEVEPGMRVSKMMHDLGGKLVEYSYPEVRTLYQAFQRGLKISANKPCLGTRSGPNLEYEWMTYKEVFEQAKQIGSALCHEGLKQGSHVGLFSVNNKEWIITDQACHAYSFIPVPIYGTYGADAAKFIIQQTEMSVILADTVQKAEEILIEAAGLPCLKVLIVANMAPGQVVKGADEAKVKVYSFTQMLNMGKNNMFHVHPHKVEDVAMICNTSGSTGMPKGVLYTNKALICNTAAVFLQMKCRLTKDDVHISYLPGAHVFERIMQIGFLQEGASIGFFRGDAKLLFEDLAALKPTMFPMVPRILSRLMDKFTANPAVQALYPAAMDEKMQLLEKGIYSRETESDKKLFGKIQAMLGGKVRQSLIGAAPIASEVLNFGRCAFGAKIPEGYGQSECTGGISITIPTEYRPGHVGPPLACNYVKLVDVEEMDITFKKDKRGEICTKGPCVMPGYFKDPAKTEEAIDADGWLHTGDIGEWTAFGGLKIVDRRKHFFKLSQGEYIAPEQLELVYNRCQLIMQLFIDGSSLQSYVVAIVVPDPETLPAFAEKLGVTGTFAELCQNKEIEAKILEEMDKLAKECDLKGFQKVKKIHVCSTPFTLEDGLLTPTMKSVRGKLRIHFKAEIDAMYKN